MSTFTQFIYPASLRQMEFHYWPNLNSSGFNIPWISEIVQSQLSGLNPKKDQKRVQSHSINQNSLH